jgi:Inovirus Gp2
MYKRTLQKAIDLDYCCQAIIDHIVDDISGMAYVSGDPRLFSEGIGMLESFLQELTEFKGTEMLPKPHLNKATNRWEIKPFNKFSIQHLPNLPFYIQKAFELPQDTRFSERVELFKEYCKANPSIFDGRVVEFCKNPINHCSSHEDYIVMRETVNQFIDQLRYQLLRPVRLKTIAARSDAVNKNWQLTKTYIKKTFKHYPTQDVIMIDLGYNNGKNIDEKESSKRIARFNKNKKRKELFQELNGFIIKPDYGKGKEFHCHLMMLFDSTKRNYFVENRLADQIVDFWAEATNGQGHVWLYNAKTGHNVNNWVSEIREVNSQDNVMLDRLLMLLEYWCKKDQFILPPRTTGKYNRYSWENCQRLLGQSPALKEH